MMVSFGYKSLLFYTCVDGTYTQIQNIPYATLGEGDTAAFEIYAIGSTYIVYVNGALVMVYEDDTYQTGSVGFRTSGKAAYTADHIKVADSGRESGQRNCRRGKTGDRQCRQESLCGQ